MASTGSDDHGGDRCRCGRAAEADHRFCPHCGAPLGDDATPSSGVPPPVPRPDPAVLGPSTGHEFGVTRGVGGSPELLDPFAPSGSIDETVRVERSGLGARLGALAAIAVVVLGAWALVRPSESEVAPEPDDAAAAAAADGSAEDTDADGDDGEAEDRDPEEEDDAPATTRQPTTSVPGARGTEAGTGDETDESPGPVVGEETGLALAFGRFDQTKIQILDLDTGEVRELERARGEPLAAIGTALIYRTNAGIPRLIELADPEASIVSPRVGGGGWSELLEVDEDRFWLIEDGPQGLSYRAYDRTGEVVDEFDVSELGTGFGYFGPMVPSASLLQHPGGGLYRRSGDEFELIAAGRALAVGDRIGLIERCDQRLSCEIGWVALDSGRAVGLPTPTIGVDASSAHRVVGGDRWLVSFDWRSGRGELIEVATGELVRELNPAMSSGPFGANLGGISEDGRWMLSQDGGDMIIVDLDDGTEWPTGLRGNVNGVFLDRPD